MRIFRVNKRRLCNEISEKFDSFYFESLSIVATERVAVNWTSQLIVEMV